MEVDAERLRVPEDPAAQVEQHVLVDPGGGDDERRTGARPAARRGQDVGDRHGDQRAVVVVAEGRYGAVDGVRHEQRARLHGRLLEQQQDRGQDDAGLHRREQGPQEGGRRARGSGERVAVEGVAVLGRGRRPGRVAPVAVVAPSFRRSARWSWAPSSVVPLGRRCFRLWFRLRSASAVSVVPDISQAYSAFVRSSSWWVPTAVMRPPESSATRSASRTVDGRWATTRAVVSARTRRRAASTRASVCTSRADSGSSRTRKRGRPTTARARARRWRWPPERLRPCSPTWVSVPWGSACDEVRLRDGQGAVQLGLAGVVLGAHEDVLAHARGEEGRLLEGDRHECAQRFPGHLGDVHAVQGDPARRDLVQPGDERGERRLARAGASHEGHGLAGADVEVDAVEDGERSPAGASG